MSQEWDAGTAVTDVAILTSTAYANDKKVNESGSFDDEKASTSDVEKAGAIAHGDDIVDVKGKSFYLCL
jgi:hypothetical protein